MSQEVEVKIKVDGSEAEKSLGTLKQQLKSAKAEVLALSDEFGVTSQQAIHAAEKAAELGHEISAANKLVKVFNPSATLNSTTQALGSVKEGFEVAGSTMKAFGTESTQLEGALEKVGVAMELTSGITAIQESAGAFKNLGATLKSYSIVQKVITAGQYLWNLAVSANPIGALVVAITAVIAAGYALTKYFIANAEASHKSEEAIKENSKALNEQIKIADKNTEAIDINSKQKLAMAKASGKSAQEIRNLELKLIDEKIAFQNSTREIAKNTYYKNLNALASLKSADADEEQIEKQEEITKAALEEFGKQNKNLTSAVKEKAAIINRQEVEITQAQTDKNAAAAKKNKEHLKELAEARKKAHEDQIKQQQEFAKATRDLQIDAGYKAQDDLEAATKANADRLLTAQQVAIKNENDAYKLKYDNAVKAGLDTQELEKDHNSKLLEIQAGFDLKQKEDKLLGIQLQLDDDTVSFDAKKQLILDRESLLLSDQSLTENQRKQIHKESVNAQMKIDEEKYKGQQELLKATSDSLDIASDIVGKNTAAGKAMAVASALINTYQGISAGVKLGYPQAIPAVLAASVTGFKAVKSILAVKTPGSSGGGGGGSISAPAPVAPSFNVVGPSGANQIAQSIGGQNQQPLKAYVVGGDVTTQQGLNRNIVSNASIG